MGGLSSYCRAFYGTLIPPGYEAMFFALYAITDKGSSAFGPAVVGRIVDTTGEIRMAFVFLAVLVVLPGPLIWWVDADRGKMDAMRMAEKLGKGEGTGWRRVGGMGGLSGLGGVGDVGGLGIGGIGGTGSVGGGGAGIGGIGKPFHSASGASLSDLISDDREGDGEEALGLLNQHVKLHGEER